MNEELKTYLNSVRREFSGKPLEEGSVSKDPLSQFGIWMEEAINAQLLDPYAMSISTVDVNMQTSTTIVYLRNVKDGGFVFYTNYDSRKGKNIGSNNKVSLHFFWGELERQVRIDGVAKKISGQDSDTYFSKRPRESQIGAWASDQSSVIESREDLEEKVLHFSNKFKDGPVPRPKNWGGYIVHPLKIEFWQGRPNRLHDRIVFSKAESGWDLSRLSP